MIPDIGAPLVRFAIFIATSAIAFVALLRAVLGRRRVAPHGVRVLWVAAVVVVGGMLFARYGARFGLPWWIYYTLPAALTLALPPLAFRMTRREAVPYLALAFLVSPVIHAAFSFFLGWKEYMPFLPVPSLADLLR